MQYGERPVEATNTISNGIEKWKNTTEEINLLRLWAILTRQSALRPRSSSTTLATASQSLRWLPGMICRAWTGTQEQQPLWFWHSPVLSCSLGSSAHGDHGVLWQLPQKPLRGTNAHQRFPPLSLLLAMLSNSCEMDTDFVPLQCRCKGSTQSRESCTLSNTAEIEV